MSNFQQVPEGKDPILLDIAQKRAGFRKHASTYIIINAFLWGIWYFSSSPIGFEMGKNYLWPIWSTLGWGAGLAFHYASAYVFPKSSATEEEYQKLRNNNYNHLIL